MQRFLVGDQKNASHFTNNRISTNIFTPFNCPFKFFYIQFSIPVNLYFLMLGTLMFHDDSPVGHYTTLGGILLIHSVLFFCKALPEDCKRCKLDDIENSQTVLVYDFDNSSFISRKYAEIKVGDIICVEGNQSFPADVVLLDSSHNSGLVYVSTANLDGESGIKPKTTFTGCNSEQETCSTCKLTEKSYDHLKDAVIERTQSQCETWNLKIKINDVTVDSDSLMFKGCYLRHTSHAVALVTYTGLDTILMMNLNRTPVKASKVDVHMDRILFALIVVTHLHNLITTILSLVNQTYNDFIALKRNNFVNLYILNALLYQSLIPLSLYTAKIVVQGLQVIQITYDKKLNSTCRVNNFQILPSLGHVDVILTDKTGTLTANNMVLKSFIYKDKNNEASIVEIESDGNSEQDFNVNLEQEEKLQKFIKCILICHTAYLSTMSDTDSTESQGYLCTSQDEEALLVGLKNFGATVVEKGVKHTKIKFGTGEEFEFENTDFGIEFSSKHKFMTVVVKSGQNYYAYTKGAFENLEPLIDRKTLIDDYEKTLEGFYKQCYRVLCMCMQQFDHPPTEEELWAKDKQEFLGFSATEDRLAHKVPLTISQLKEADIKIHMATGDNPVTAESIAFACNLVHKSTDTCVLRPEDYREGELKLYARSPMKPGEYAVFNTKMIDEALKDRKSFIDFLKSGTCIFSRAEPSQKAAIARAMKETLDLTVLTIGDGANDVGMIQKGSVGIGISGKEGKMASNAGDFSIACFRHLAKLVLVYGAWNYNRIVKSILFFLYKDITFFVSILCFVYYNQFDSVLFYDSITSLLYTFIFSSFLILTISAFDFRIASILRIQYPVLYKESKVKNKLSMYNFCTWAINGLFHGLVIFYLVLHVLTKFPIITPLGNVASWNYMQLVVISTVITVVTIKAFTETYQISCFYMLFSCSSLIFYFLYLSVVLIIVCQYAPLRNFLDQSFMVGAFAQLMLTPQTYFIIANLTILCIIRDILWKYLKRTFFWRIEDLTMEYELGLRCTYESQLFKYLKDSKKMFKSKNSLQ